MKIKNILTIGLIITAMPAAAHADWRHDHDGKSYNRGFKDSHAEDRWTDRRNYGGPDYRHADFDGPQRWNNDYKWDRTSERSDHNFGDRGFEDRGSRGRGFGSNDDNAIRAGVRDGQLTGREVGELRSQKENIENERQRYLSDGHLSDKEKTDLRKDTDYYNKSVQHELTDGEHR